MCLPSRREPLRFPEFVWVLAATETRIRDAQTAQTAYCFGARSVAPGWGRASAAIRAPRNTSLTTHLTERHATSRDLNGATCWRDCGTNLPITAFRSWMPASRQDIRLNIVVRAARLVFWNAPRSAFFGYSYATERNKTPLNATGTQRLLKPVCGVRGLDGAQTDRVRSQLPPIDSATWAASFDARTSRGLRCTITLELPRFSCWTAPLPAHVPRTKRE